MLDWYDMTISNIAPFESLWEHRCFCWLGLSNTDSAIAGIPEDSTCLKGVGYVAGLLQSPVILLRIREAVEQLA